MNEYVICRLFRRRALQRRVVRLAGLGDQDGRGLQAGGIGHQAEQAQRQLLRQGRIGRIADQVIALCGVPEPREGTGGRDDA